jgi:hypothetical protein
MSIENLLKTNVNEHLSYNPDTGLFTWRMKRGNKAAGSIAGSQHNNGYHTIFLCGRRFYAHRLAFLFMRGNLPTGVVDHINGVKNDNRWINLRDVSQSENMANRSGAQKNSKTKHLCVSPHVAGGYVVQIRRNKKRIYVGYFKELEAALVAYKGAANEYL